MKRGFIIIFIFILINSYLVVAPCKTGELEYKEPGLGGNSEVTCTPITSENIDQYLGVENADEALVAYYANPANPELSNAQKDTFLSKKKSEKDIPPAIKDKFTGEDLLRQEPDWIDGSDLTKEQYDVVYKKIGWRALNDLPKFIESVLTDWGIIASDKPKKGNGVTAYDNGDLKTLDLQFEQEDALEMPNPLSNSKPYIGDDGVSYLKGFPDSDKDGLSDDFEANNGLDKASKDSDGDGLTDYDEYHKYPTNPKKFNTYPEYGLKNDKEFVEALQSGKITSLFFNGVDLISFLGLSPSTMFKDSDGDGISDLNEQIYQQNS